MIVMILERVPSSLRGTLSRWLIEPSRGVFVGHVSGMVREQLWDKCKNNKHTGGVVQVWNSNNEQRFKMRMVGNTKRRLLDLEGLQLVEIPRGEL
ncbi:MAG: type I-E CRISPR-associated endoribonuclease Cas2 [Anaerolineaceae bacterium]|nr:type I-E CRISPR-associated endoribonuclease Cas2 [Anaerolineaceae bacterium]